MKNTTEHYTFCETEHVRPISKSHIRKLTDTKSLCGITVSLNRDIHKHKCNFKNSLCLKCINIFENHKV